MGQSSSIGYGVRRWLLHITLTLLYQRSRRRSPILYYAHHHHHYSLLCARRRPFEQIPIRLVTRTSQNSLPFNSFKTSAPKRYQYPLFIHRLRMPSAFSIRITLCSSSNQRNSETSTRPSLLFETFRSISFVRFGDGREKTRGRHGRFFAYLLPPVGKVVILIYAGTPYFYIHHTTRMTIFIMLAVGSGRLGKHVRRGWG